MSRVRVETRSRHQSDLRRVMHSTEKVRKWEKKWVRVEETSLQIFKWMPIIKKDEQNPQQPQPQQQQQQQQHQQQLEQQPKQQPQQQQPMQQPQDTTFNPEPQTIPLNNDRRGFSHLESNKRPHENDGPVVESPDAKRAKVSTGLKLTDSAETLGGSHMLAPMQSVGASDVKYDLVSSRPEMTQAPRTDDEMAVPHLAVVPPSSVTQPHVQSTMASETTVCSNGDQSMTVNDVSLTATNGGGDDDDEAMDTDDIGLCDPTMQTPSTNLTTPQALDTEDFSSIARTVTEQIVLKVSDCYGGDS